MEKPQRSPEDLAKYRQAVDEFINHVRTELEKMPEMPDAHAFFCVMPEHDETNKFYTVGCPGFMLDTARNLAKDAMERMIGEPLQGVAMMPVRVEVEPKIKGPIMGKGGIA